MKKLAIIGAGMISYSHAAAIESLPDASLCSVADINETAAGKLAQNYNCRYYTDAESMLRKEELDVVIICLPTFLHEKYVTLCASFGVAILCEKPIEITVQAAERMLEAVRKSGVIFMVAQVVRFWTGYAEIKEMADAGELGDVYMAFASRCSERPMWGNSWLINPKHGGGAIQDMHVHDIDYFRYLLGPMDYLFCHANKDDTNCWNHVMTSIAFKNGQKAVAEAAFTMKDGYPFTMALKIAATKATIEFRYTAGYNIGMRNTADSEIRIYRPGKEPLYKKPDLYDGYLKQLAYFLDCVDKGIQPDRVPQTQNMEVIRAVCAAKESAERQEIIILK